MGALPPSAGADSPGGIFSKKKTRKTSGLSGAKGCIAAMRHWR